ncbi:MAG: hypothetical protein ACP5KY_08165 [Thermoproteus sp.]
MAFWFNEREGVVKVRRVDPVEEVAELIASLPPVEGLRQIGLRNKSTRCAADSSVPSRTVPRADAGPLRGRRASCRRTRPRRRYTS